MSISTTTEVTSETKDTSDNDDRDRDRDENKELLNNKQLMEALRVFLCRESESFNEKIQSMGILLSRLKAHWQPTVFMKTPLETLFECHSEQGESV